MTANPPADPPPGPAPVSSAAVTTFAGDVGAVSLREAISAYVRRVRGGEVGALPALLALSGLVLFFATASPTFFTRGNLANLLSQGAGTTVIAMGLVFVLLLGEIDLAAGTASGVCGATMALAVTKDGHISTALGRGTYLVLAAVLVTAIAGAVWMRLFLPAGIVAGGALLIVTGNSGHVVPSIAAAVSVGVAIGIITGFLVAKVGIPSFVVTLALFLAWQGVVLKFLGDGGNIPVRDYALVNGIANSNLSVPFSWIFCAFVVVGFGGFSTVRIVRRRRQQLTADPLSLVALRVGGLAVAGVLAVYFLTQERGPNPSVVSIKGIPNVVPLIGGLFLIGHFVLTRTSYGRHLYAVGGNPEAARRAGINVPRMRMSVFTIGSGMAAVGGVVLASRLGSVDPQAGGGNQLLYAVGAAVIGGTSLFGGRGRLRDALIGGLVIATIDNGLVLLRQPAAIVFIVTGLVLLVAASIDALTRKRVAASSL
jgi:D-xylose transport system permease protein